MPIADQGVTRDRYMLIPRVLIFLTRGTSVMLLKGAPTKRLWANRYNGIGGHVEAGEDILSAARRELFEESGLSAELHLCGTVLVDTGQNPGIGIFVFTGECPQGQLAPSPEGPLEWVDLDQVPALPVVEDLPVLLERIRKMRLGDPPFWARSSYDESGRLQLIFTQSD